MTTVTLAEPVPAMSAAGTVAVNSVDDTKAVAIGFAFHSTDEPLTYPLPVMVSVNCGPPAVTEVGAIRVKVGAGLSIGNDAAVDVPPPGAALTTVTDAVPAVAIRLDPTVTCSFVLLTYVVVNGEAFQSTVEPDTKLLPFTVSVN